MNPPVEVQPSREDLVPSSKRAKDFFYYLKKNKISYF
jgi:hypothetical protein